MSDISPEQLTAKWNSLRDGAGEAINWVENVRGNAPSVDSEAEGIIEKLRRVRNLSKRLGAVSSRPMSVGFFGLSQAGKSYLISSLAAGANGQLETEYDGNRLDFITHVNPPGGGKEATGLVTRFTRQAEAGPRGFPIELRLFSEIDLAKILGNSFLNDFDKEKVDHNLDSSHIHELLNDLESSAAAVPNSEIDADEVVDLWDYFQQRYAKTSSALQGEYWPRAINLAPRLDVSERAKLFSVLWGEVDIMTSVYEQMARSLDSLGGAERVYAPLSVVVEDLGDGKFDKSSSIMNVDILARLGGEKDDNITLRPVLDGKPGKETSISRAVLAGLTVELVFPLVEPCVTEGIETVDLLDFPGYRGRYDLTSREAAAGSNPTGDGPMIADLILRGKVAYLFERYTEQQEMNVLIVCTPSNKQSEVTEVGPVLTDWINQTQGASSEVRANRSPGLVWAITMFDYRIGDNLATPKENLSLIWGDGGLMKMTLLERFGSYSWLHNWSDGKAFNNVFLVRKPRLPVTFLELEENNEKDLHPTYVGQLSDMRETFVADETIQKHVKEPGDAWDGMLSLNDGGMARLANYLRDVTGLSVKLNRLREQYEEAVLETCDQMLGRYYLNEGAGETDKKRAIAKEVTGVLQKRAALIGDLLCRMQPDPDSLRAVYLRAGEDVKPEAEQADEEHDGALNTDGLISLDLDDSIIAPTSEDDEDEQAVLPPDRRFARAAMREWLKHLRSIPEDGGYVLSLGIPKEQLNALFDEIITGAMRLGVEQRIYERTAKGEREVSAKSDKLVARQALYAQREFADFLGDLGSSLIDDAERPDSAASKALGVMGRKVFDTPKTNIANGLPVIDDKPLNYTAVYLLDWMKSFETLCVGNAGHSAGREITPDQNEALGVVMASMKGD